MAMTEVGEELVLRPMVFVSHASEDKAYVKNLVDTLLRYSINAWYDAYEIQPGQSIRQRINDGLRQAEYGVVVLSPSFFAKSWTLEEIDALHGALQKGRLIPVILDMDVDDLRRRDPLIAAVRGIVAGQYETIRGVVAQIARVVLGAGRFENGRLYYRNETVTLLNVPRDSDMRIAGATFENCVLQGPVMVALGTGPVRFERTYFNGPESFLAVPPDAKIVGAIALDDCHFLECRFKDVGFITFGESFPDIPWFDEPLPAHLL